MDLPAHLLARTTDDDDASPLGGKTALVTGSVALGALLTGAVYRRLRQNNLPGPDEVPPALSADLHEMEMMEGRARYYERPGSGVPIVLLHSLNAAASSLEMKPLFDHFAETTGRPLFAVDWLGFGASDRPPVRYTPDLYLRQLRRFLSEVVHQPADLVALSLGCEYAAIVAYSLPYLVRRFVGIAPTAVSRDPEPSFVRRAVVELASSVGAFEIAFHRLARREVLRRFYERQVFHDPADVPEALVDYAFRTTHVRGAHYAPRYFIEGRLFTTEAARHAYAHLRVPTLFVTPASAEGLVQQFGLLEAVVTENAGAITVRRLASGLLPQWDAPGPLFEAVDAFLASEEPVAV